MKKSNISKSNTLYLLVWIYYKLSFWMLFVLIILFYMPRLTELSVDARELTQENFDKLEKFFYSKALKSLKYQRMRSQKPLESFLLQLLHSNSNLQHLKIYSKDGLVVTRCLFEKLMSSNLKSCLLDIRGNVSVQDLDSVVSCPLDERNTTASPSFTIHLSNIEDHQDSNVVSFLQCLPNVHRLRMYRMTPNILQTLFKYQVKILYSYSLFNITTR